MDQKKIIEWDDLCPIIRRNLSFAYNHKTDQYVWILKDGTIWGGPSLDLVDKEQIDFVIKISANFAGGQV